MTITATATAISESDSNLLSSLAYYLPADVIRSHAAARPTGALSAIDMAHNNRLRLQGSMFDAASTAIAARIRGVVTDHYGQPEHRGGYIWRRLDASLRIGGPDADEETDERVIGDLWDLIAHRPYQQGAWDVVRAMAGVAIECCQRHGLPAPEWAIATGAAEAEAEAEV